LDTWFEDAIGNFTQNNLANYFFLGTNFHESTSVASERIESEFINIFAECESSRQASGRLALKTLLV